MTRRYHVPDLVQQAPTVTLNSAETLHAAKVMRLHVGDGVELFDGQGHQCTAEIISLSSKRCVCTCETPVRVDREAGRPLEIAVAMPKPDRAKEMIERLSELGVVRVWPLRCERTQRDPPASLATKLQRIIIEACKQSGRNQQMFLEPMMTLDAFLADLAENGDPRARRWVATPGGSTVAALLDAEETDAPESPAMTIALVGPEGGLSDSETARVSAAGFVPVGLGDRTLRIETAAVAIASRLLIP